MTEDSINQEALDWHDALARDDADWDAFTRWMEADARHRRAYDEVALVADRIEAHRSVLAALLPPAGMAAPRRAWPLWLGGSAAAAVAAAFSLVVIGPGEKPDEVFRTGRGQFRTVALADGSSVEMAPASLLRVRPGGDQLALEGAASFTVPHRPGRTLTVEAGGLTVQDIGTVFEVATGGQAVRVQVAQGQVGVAAPELAEPVTVTQGRKLIVDRSAGVAALRPAREFASWRRGRLVYDDAPLSFVAAEVQRYAGRRVVVGPDLAGRRFSGVLTIGDGSRLVDDLARLMGVEVQRDAAMARLVALPDR